MTPVLTLDSSLWALLTMTNCKNESFSWTTTFNVVGDQLTSDNVITNWPLVVANCLAVGLALVNYSYSVEECIYPGVAL